MYTPWAQAPIMEEALCIDHYMEYPYPWNLPTGSHNQTSLCYCIAPFIVFVLFKFVFMSALPKGLCLTIRQWTRVFYEQKVNYMMLSWHNYGWKKTRVRYLIVVVETILVLWHILYKNNFYVFPVIVFFLEVLDMVRNLKTVWRWQKVTY